MADRESSERSPLSLPERLAAFEAVFAKVNGYRLSHQDRSSRKSRSWVYGEVLPTTFVELLSWTEPKSTSQFVDLGSGVGKAVLLAALAFPFSQLTGVEKLPRLVRAARGALTRFNRQLRPLLSPEQRRAPIDFLEADLREVDLRKADVVFAHASCFEPALADSMAEKCARELPSGGRVLVVGKALQTGAGLTLVSTRACEMEWGEDVAHLYVRR